ncbi:unnamed protein product [Miscanthus lutarioriparius]|uniref:DNA topoisomerase 2 n=1 Tax=Miscanthus lutarioriparius TaxID=422564 RepID=A0A811PJS4_9POAL|nr:unnamed protein product [Miscanthus lutarioriparius]
MAGPLNSSSGHNAAAGGGGKTIEEMYQKKTQLEHILLRPDTYIGSVEKHTQPLWVYEDSGMVNRSVTYVPGLYKIFDEILVNAADNKQRDPKMDALRVEIDVDGCCISVYNNGDGIPVEIHQEEGVYVPEMIFGHLLTSSNYNDNEKKTTGGRNGYGAKLTNIFSTEFVIETADGRRQKKYKQVFSENMGKKSEPQITKCKQGENWTRVTFKPDLAKFNMTHLEDDVVALMRKRVVDMAGTLGKTVKVELDGQRVPIKSFCDYVDLYMKSANCDRPDKMIYEKNDRWEVCVSQSEGQFQQVSFVNRIATIRGGTHVDYITNQIANHVMAIVNKKNKNANMKLHNVKSHLWVFVNTLIDNPAFDSQTKETLTTRQGSFGSKFELSSAFFKKVETSSIIENVLSWADFKLNKELKKTDGSKKSRISGIPKLEDANEAGGKDSEKCTLILTEGDSAKALAMSGIAVVGRDYYGVFPLRGKLLNVREANHKQIMDNAEIQHIKQILGLQHGKQYESTKGLRYGHLMIMTDQDHDGSHIKGLLINFIHSFWPSLLKVESFLVEFVTPIIKGLGTSTAQEGREYFEAITDHKKDFVWEDDQDGNHIELAFSKKRIADRKQWLTNFQRSIPSMVDGLKPGQRKILFCSFKRNFVKEAKVAQFSGYVSEHSAYHHGEQSLASTIIGMAQNFVGSNNINLMYPGGQFGTRAQGGKDAASPRYIFTKLSHITRSIFPKDDDILLNYLNEDGQSIEPTWYMPILPMVLVNGSEGIGTGWSTFIPNYNPRDIVANLRRLLNEESTVPMHPWYKGFKGSIEKTVNTKVVGSTYTVTGIIEVVNNTTLRITELPIRRWTQDYKDFLESICADKHNKDKLSFIEDVTAQGDNEDIYIELQLSEGNMNIAKEEGLVKKFKLTTTIGTSNMHLFDSDGKIRKYDTPEQILEEFFQLRLEFYVKRKEAMLKSIKLDLKKLENKVRKKKRAEPAAVGALEEEENEESPEAEGAEPSDYEYLLAMSIGTLTLEKIQELNAEKQKLVDGVEELKNTSPKSLWLKDLDAFEKELDVLDQMDVEEEERREKRIKEGKKGGSKAGPKKQRKKAAVNKEKSDTEDDDVVEPVVPKRGAQRKKASKKAPVDEEEVDMPSLKDRIAALSFNDSSPDHSAMETETTEEQNEKLATKGPSKRGGGKKAASSSLAMIPSDDEDDDFTLEEVSEVQAQKKGRGKKPAAAVKPKAPATRKRAPAQGKATQKKIDEMLQAIEANNTSPEKKRGSTAASASSETTAEASPPSGSSAEPVGAAQPRRTARATKKPVYVTDSDPEDEVVELTDDSDFDLDGDSDE